MDQHPAINELTQIVGIKNVITDRNELRVYECDGFSIAKGMPLAVVLPESTQQVSAVVKLLAAHNLSIVPRGSGTGRVLHRWHPTAATGCAAAAAPVGACSN